MTDREKTKMVDLVNE